MGLLARLLEPRRRALTANEAIRGLWASASTSSGVAVSEQTALQIITVFTAVRILSETFAQVPLKVYRRGVGGARVEAPEHPLYRVLHERPNPEMTSFTLREVALGHVCTWGNSYWEISRNFHNEVIGLWPLLPNRTKKKRGPDRKIFYLTTVPRDNENGQVGTQVRLEADQVLHIPGLGFDGMVGYSVISMIREGLGLAKAYEEFGAKFFANGAQPGFVLSTDKDMKPEKRTEIEKVWAENHQGLTNAQRMAILDGGLKPEKIGIPPEDAQFLQGRQYQRGEILGFYRVPPHMAGDTEKSTSWGTGIEQMSRGFVTYSMMPYFARFEQAINVALLSANAQGPLFAEFVVDGLLRGDFKTRQEGYAIGRQWGWLSVNDIRSLENLPPIGDQGDVYLSPLAMVPADRVDDVVDKQIAPHPLSAPLPGAQSGTGSAALEHVRALRAGGDDAIKVDVHVDPPQLHLHENAVKVEAPVTVNVPERSVQVDAPVTIEEGAVRVEQPPATDMTFDYAGGVTPPGALKSITRKSSKK